MSEDARCASCPAFLAPIGVNRYGECRRHAPFPPYAFPAMKLDDWCAEHPARAGAFERPAVEPTESDDAVATALHRFLAARDADRESRVTRISP